MLPSSRSVRAAAWIVGLFLLLPGCVVSTTRPSATSLPPVATPGTPSPTPKPDKGGTLVVALPAEPDVLNFTLTESPESLDTLSTLDARMIRIRDDGELEPQLLAQVPTLENGGISSDGQTWVLHFQPKLKWSDGEPLDARDLLFTWKTMNNPNYPATSRAGWSDISSIALGADYLSATLSLINPSGELLDTIFAGGSESTAGFLLPAHLFENMPVADIARSDYSDSGHVGSGPFKIGKWSQGDQIVLERNENFFGTEARLDRIVLRFTPDTREVMTNLSTGELDVGVDLSETSVVDLRQIPNINAQITPKAGAVEMIYLNLDDPEDLSRPHPVLSDLTVRQALVLGFNRQKVVDEFLLGQTSVAISPLDYTRWSAPDLRPYDYDPARANQLLDGSGWLRQADGIRQKEGVRLSLRLAVVQGEGPQAVLGQRIAKAFVTDMANIGVEVQQQEVDSSQLLGESTSIGMLASRLFDAVDPLESQRTGVTHFDWRFNSANIPRKSDPLGGNIMGYENIVVDAALEGQRRSVDQRSRSEFLDAAQRAIYRDLPVIPIYDHFEVDVSRSYVNGLSSGPISGLWWNTEDWWINRDKAAP